MSGVVAPFAQNVMGGLGVAVIAGLLGMALWPDAGLRIFKGAAIAGAVVFGGACAIRAFRDEIDMIVASYAAGSLDATTEALRAENQRLLAEIDRLKSDGMVANQWGAREAAERLMTDYWRAVAANVDLHGFLAREATMQRWGVRGARNGNTVSAS